MRRPFPRGAPIPPRSQEECHVQHPSDQVTGTAAEGGSRRGRGRGDGGARGVRFGRRERQGVVAHSRRRHQPDLWLDRKPWLPKGGLTLGEYGTVFGAGLGRYLVNSVIITVVCIVLTV